MNHTSPQSNCLNCSQQMLWNQRSMDEPWQNARQFNGSNMSLNLPPNGYFPQQFDMTMGPPPAWMNTYRGGAPEMYPYPNGMMPAYPNQSKQNLVFSILNLVNLLIRAPFSITRSEHEASSKHAEPFTCSLAGHITSTKHQIQKERDV